MGVTYVNISGVKVSLQKKNRCHLSELKWRWSLQKSRCHNQRQNQENKDETINETNPNETIMKRETILKKKKVQTKPI